MTAEQAGQLQHVARRGSPGQVEILHHHAGGFHLLAEPAFAARRDDDDVSGAGPLEAFREMCHDLFRAPRPISLNEVGDGQTGKRWQSAQWVVQGRGLRAELLPGKCRGETRVLKSVMSIAGGKCRGRFRAGASLRTC